MEQSIEIMVPGMGWEEGAVAPEADSLLLKGEKRSNGKREVKAERIKSLLGAPTLSRNSISLSGWPLPNYGVGTLSPPSPAEMTHIAG